MRFRQTDEITTLQMAKKKFSDIQAYLKAHPWLDKWVVNKYTVTTLIFGVFFLFVGDQCIVKQVRRVRQARHLQRQIDESRRNIATYERELQTLSNPDSLERYAREHYNMHAPNEDVYIVK